MYMCVYTYIKNMIQKLYIHTYNKIQSTKQIRQNITKIN